MKKTVLVDILGASGCVYSGKGRLESGTKGSKHTIEREAKKSHHQYRVTSIYARAET